VQDFSNGIYAKKAKSITPKDEDIESVFFSFLERNYGNEKWKKYNRPKEENKGNIYLPQQG
jgi:hypothetical protein